MADQATIMACRQRIDFYFWKGMPVARSWPRRRSGARTAGEILSSQRFWAMTGWTTNIAAKVEAEYRAMMVGRGVTWIDFQRAMFAGKSWLELV